MHLQMCPHAITIHIQIRNFPGMPKRLPLDMQTNAADIGININSMQLSREQVLTACQVCSVELFTRR